MRLREAGRSLAEIAEELGVHRMTVVSWLPTRQEEESGIREEMARMRLKGMSNIEIAEAMGTSRNRVGALLGPAPRVGPPTDERRKIVVRVADKDYDRIVARLAELGIPHEGVKNRPHPLTVMLEHIAAGDLILTRSD